MSDQKIENWMNYIDDSDSVNNYLSTLKKEIHEIQQSSNYKEELTLYTALGNKIRLSILKMLEKKELCTCVLSSVLGLQEGSISHHLKILEKAGLIFGLKKGLYTVYHTKKGMMELLTA